MRPDCTDSKNAEILYSGATSRFIDNVMTALLGLNRLEDRAGLEESLLRLSRMMQYIGEKERSVTLREEGVFVEHYLALQRVRFSDRLMYRIDMGEGAEKVRIGRFELFSEVCPAVERLMERSGFHGTIVLERRGSEKPSPIFSIRLETLDGTVSVSPLRLRGRRGRMQSSTAARPSFRKLR